MSDSESKRLEKLRVAVTNAKTHEEINPLLAEFGMDETKLNEGQTIYEETLAKYENYKKEKRESKIAKTDFHDLLDDIHSTFRKHRNFALRLFKRSPATLIQLGLEGEYPTRYDEIFKMFNHFYSTIANNTEIQAEFTKIKVTPEVITECINKYNQLLASRADYTKELGETQNAYDEKIAAFIVMDEWKDDFDDIARIALYDKPQLLEVLGIFVRS